MRGGGVVLKANRPNYSGKHPRHGLHVLALTDEKGRLIRISAARPGRTHDITPARRDHLLVEWWKQGAGAGTPDTWASYVGTDRQYTEYYDLKTDANGTVTGTGQVLFREYYDLVSDPYQLQNLLHQATPQQEQALGIPALAAQLA
ncbi:transposase family protein, partial [Kitasatospora nipponensis]|uniref:transposase family protein n=1 Tax=Kitasatospora nipponensis TaxID=258049 RepID=UPI0031E43A4A